MPVKQKTVYERTCDKCGKMETLNKAPLMISDFGSTTRYLCKKCMKDFLLNHTDFFKNEKTESDKNEEPKSSDTEKLKIVTIRIEDMSYDFCFSNNDKPVNIKADLESTIQFMIGAYLFEKMDMIGYEDGNEVELSFKDTEGTETYTIGGIAHIVQNLELKKFFEFNIHVTVNTKGKVNTFTEKCRLERVK